MDPSSRTRLQDPSKSAKLKFGVDRILSDEITPKRNAGVVLAPVALPALLAAEGFSSLLSHPSNFQSSGSTAYLQDTSSVQDRLHAAYPLAYRTSPYRLAHYSAVFSSLLSSSTSGFTTNPDTLQFLRRPSATLSPPGSPGRCLGGGGEGAKRKRSWSRAVFSNLQRKGLEKRFGLQKYITKPDRRQLAATLGLTDAQVKVWFQNRRMKWRHSKEGRDELQARAFACGTETGPDGTGSGQTGNNLNLPHKNDHLLYQVKSEAFQAHQQRHLTTISTATSINSIRQ